MSYNTYATEDGVEYLGLVCESLGSANCYLVDILDARDALSGQAMPVPEDGLLLDLTGLVVKSGDQIWFQRVDGEFIFSADQQNPASH